MYVFVHICLYFFFMFVFHVCISSLYFMFVFLLFVRNKDRFTLTLPRKVVPSLIWNFIANLYAKIRRFINSSFYVFLLDFVFLCDWSGNYVRRFYSFVYLRTFWNSLCLDLWHTWKGSSYFIFWSLTMNVGIVTVVW